MENFNTFRPPVDANTGEPIFPPEPSQQFGYASNEQGYGSNEKGQDIERNDLDSEYFNAESTRRADTVYANAEAEMAAENQAFEDAWNAEDAEKERDDKIHLALAGARDAIKEANARLDAIEAIIKEGQERAERMGVKELNSEEVTDTAAAKPSIDSTNLQNMATAAPSASTESISAESPEKEAVDSTTTIPSVDNTELKNIATAAPSASEDSINTEAPEKSATKDVYYLGKGGIRYSKREDAIASFQD